MGEILHEEACFEDLYDPGCEAVFENCLDDQYADGVLMEFDWWGRKSSLREREDQ